MPWKKDKKTSKDKFISQCVAQSPNDWEKWHTCKMNNDGTSCLICKRTLEEITKWGETSFEDRETLCAELLDR